MPAGEFVHFRCAWHAIEGHFDPGQGKQPRGGFYVKCEFIGCENRGLAYWYKGAKFADLPRVDKIILG